MQVKSYNRNFLIYPHSTILSNDVSGFRYRATLVQDRRSWISKSELFCNWEFMFDIFPPIWISVGEAPLVVLGIRFETNEQQTSMISYLIQSGCAVAVVNTLFPDSYGCNFDSMDAFDLWLQNTRNTNSLEQIIQSAAFAAHERLTVCLECYYKRYSINTSLRKQIKVIGIAFGINALSFLGVQNVHHVLDNMLYFGCAPDIRLFCNALLERMRTTKAHEFIHIKQCMIDLLNAPLLDFCSSQVNVCYIIDSIQSGSVGELVMGKECRLHQVALNLDPLGKLSLKTQGILHEYMQLVLKDDTSVPSSFLIAVHEPPNEVSQSAAADDDERPSQNLDSFQSGAGPGTLFKSSPASQTRQIRHDMMSVESQSQNPDSNPHSPVRVSLDYIPNMSLPNNNNNNNNSNDNEKSQYPDYYLVPSSAYGFAAW